MTNVYAGMEDGLLVITGQPGDWQVDQHLEDRQPQTVAPDPTQSGHIYCGTFDEGIWRSEDTGASWERIGEDLDHQRVMAMAVGTDGVVWVGTEPSAVFRSADGGDSWERRPGLTKLRSAPDWSFPPRPETHHVRWLEPDPLDPQHLYVCIENGALVHSPDGGQSWNDRVPGSPRDTHTLATHPDAPDRLYSAAGDGFIRPGYGYAESTDGGGTWERPAEGLEHHYLWSVAVDPADPETRVISAAASPENAHNPQTAESVIYRRTGDEPWQQCTAASGLPDAKGTVIPVVATNESDPGEFYALTNHGLYWSADAGVTWEPIDVPWPQGYQYQHPQALAVTTAD